MKRPSKYAGVGSVRVIRPVTVDSDGSMWVGNDRVYFINGMRDARLRRGAKAVGFHNNRPVFNAQDFYTHLGYWPGDRFASRRDENMADESMSDAEADERRLEEEDDHLSMGGFWDVGGLGEYP